MISRRPNTRASTEYAPGPRRAIAISIVATSMIGNFSSNRVGVQAGRIENPTLIMPRSIRIATTGVRKPTNNKAPAARATKPTNHAPGVEFGAPR
jgi:hypothetical protein